MRIHVIRAVAIALVAFCWGLLSSDTIFIWVATPKALHVVAARMEKAAQLKEKIAELERQP